MKNLEKILTEKSTERKIREDKLKKEEEEKELKRKEEKLKQKELERLATNIRRKKASIKFASENALHYGFIGLIIGAVIGFGKGCVRYGNSLPTSTGYKPFLEPFRYIPENALLICIIGVIIGIFVGMNKGQNS